MSPAEPEPSSSSGHQRRCPHCGTRVAQKAHTCFFCGAVLADAPRRRLRVPWPDLVLFLVLGGLLVFWWLQSPVSAPPSRIALMTVTAVPDTPTPSPSPWPTATPSPTATATSSPTPAPTPLRHKVAPGDTLELIAGQYGSTIKEIIEANGLSADGFIRVGDELLIPLAGARGGAGPTATPAGGVLIYTVQPGDTIETIAMRFRSQVDWILRANGIKATDILSIGQALQVPLTEATPTPGPPARPTLGPTFTPAIGFSAPILLTPADGATITGNNDVLLSWTAVGVLGKDQWYVVTVRIAGAASQPAPYWTKSTTWRLPASYRLPGATGSEFTWQVQVMAGTPNQSGQPLSPASTPRTFTWR